MCVENQKRFDLDTNIYDEKVDLIVGSGVRARWWELERRNMSNEVHVGERSLAALCKACAILHDRKENGQTKQLLMKPLWERQGD